MKLISIIKRKFLRSITNNLSIAIYSFIIAIIAWFVISITIYPSTPKTINNINLSLDISQTSADENGLEVISCDVDKINVQIEGDRSQIGNLTKDDIVAKLDVDNVLVPGTKKLSIKIENKSGVDFKVNKVTPDSASVVFDKIETREFELVAEYPNITFEEGKTRDAVSCEPKTIKIKGPSAQLDQIATCAAVTNKTDKLNSSYSFACDEIKLYNGSGAIIDNSSLDIEATNITINIPVLTQKTLDLSVEISKKPSNFDDSAIKLNWSTDKITLASQTSSLSEFPDTLEVGKILLSELDLDYTKTFRIDTKDFINQSNLETVTVSLDSSNLDKKELIATDFSISNAPANYDFKVVTSSLNVVLVGPADEIAKITTKDIVVDVNLLDCKNVSPSFTYPVTVTCPNYNSVWAVGVANVTLACTEKSSSTT